MMHNQTFAGYGARLREFIGKTSRLSESKSCAGPADSEFNELACELFQLQFTNNPAYRRLCEARGVASSSISQWRAIPAVPTVAFKELQLTSLAPGERTTVFHSSGTTKHRASSHFHNTESLALYEAALLPWFHIHLLAETVRPRPSSSNITTVSRTKEEDEHEDEPSPMQMVFLTPPVAAAPHSSLVHMFEMIRREFGSVGSLFTGIAKEDGWSLNLEQTVSVLGEAVVADRPVAVLGTAFNFVHLLDHLSERQMHLSLPPGSRAMETGGYKGRSRVLTKPALHALITEFLGIPATHIVTEYGMSELSSQAYDHAVPHVVRIQPGERESLDATRNMQQASRFFRFPLWVRVQIISPETGREVSESETGLLRVFDLANVYSVMAIQTEDLAVRYDAGFELMGRAPAAEARGCSLLIA